MVSEKYATKIGNLVVCVEPQTEYLKKNLLHYISDNRLKLGKIYAIVDKNTDPTYADDENFTQSEYVWIVDERGVVCGYSLAFFSPITTQKHLKLILQNLEWC